MVVGKINGRSVNDGRERANALRKAETRVANTNNQSTSAIELSYLSTRATYEPQQQGAAETARLPFGYLQTGSKELALPMSEWGLVGQALSAVT